jgi:hypothetical protein
MSETPGPAGFAASESDPAADRKKRLTAIIGLGAVVAILGGGGYFLLMTGNDAPAAVTSALPTSRSTRSATPSASAKPSAAPTPPPVVATEPARLDPFKPLYSPAPVPVESTTAAPPAVGPSAGASGTPGGGLVSGGPTVGPGTTPSAGQNVVRFTSIDSKPAKPTVTVSLDGVILVGAAGDVLGGTLKVVSIRPDDGAATFQLGEATFDLHIGQSYIN